MLQSIKGARRGQRCRRHAAPERQCGDPAGTQSALHGRIAFARDRHLSSHSYMLALQGDAEERGAMLAFHSPVQKGRAADDGTRSSSAAPSR